MYMIFPITKTFKQRERDREKGVKADGHGLTSLSLPKITDCDVRGMGGSRPGPAQGLAGPACNITSSTSCHRGERCSSLCSSLWSSSIGDRADPPAGL